MEVNFVSVDFMNIVLSYTRDEFVTNIIKWNVPIKGYVNGTSKTSNEHLTFYSYDFHKDYKDAKVILISKTNVLFLIPIKQQNSNEVEEDNKISETGMKDGAHQ